MGVIRRSILLLCVMTPALIPAVSKADAANDPLGFQLSAAALTVHEAAGEAVVTVERSPLEGAFAAQVRYITSGEGYDPATGGPFSCPGTPCTAIAGTDFTSVKGELDFRPGQTSAQFSFPIADEHVATVSKTLMVSLFGPSPIGLGPTGRAVVTIVYDDPSPPLDPSNPLAVSAASGSGGPSAGFRSPVSGNPSAGSGNPLAGARFFVDPQSEAAKAARRYPALRIIASQAGTARFGRFSIGSPYVPDIGTAVSRYLARAAATQPGAVPLLATYTLVHGVRGDGDPPAFQAWYHNFIERFARGIGSFRAVLFLEEDSLITSPGLKRRGLAVRMHELQDAISILAADCPHLVIYLDAGAADALPARVAARLLVRAGVAEIQGFFLNSTHYDWTSKEIRYGEQISRMTGGKHFVVNTGSNGQGPLRPRDIVHQGNEVLCNPVGRGLGPRPTTATGYPNVDMFAWTTNPGESGGQCYTPDYEMPGAPSTGAYWPLYALMLVRNADFSVR
jgi:endoglucanase